MFNRHDPPPPKQVAKINKNLWSTERINLKLLLMHLNAMTLMA